MTILTEKIGLTAAHAELFTSIMATKTLEKKEHLLQEGNVCNFLGIVARGTLRSYLTNGDQEFNNDFFFEGDFITAYTSFLNQAPASSNIQALTPAEVCYVTHAQLDALVAQDIHWLKLGKYVSDSFFIQKCRRESSFLKHTAAERFASLLNNYPGIEQQVSQYHIASYLGIKPESLSRIKLLTYINK
jgi:CRP-like cAMP-binding protein